MPDCLSKQYMDTPGSAIQLPTEFRLVGVPYGHRKTRAHSIVATARNGPDTVFSPRLRLPMAAASRIDKVGAYVHATLPRLWLGAHMSIGQARIVTFDDMMGYLSSHDRTNAEKGDLWERVTA